MAPVHIEGNDGSITIITDRSDFTKKSPELANRFNIEMIYQDRAVISAKDLPLDYIYEGQDCTLHAHQTCQMIEGGRVFFVEDPITGVEYTIRFEK